MKAKEVKELREDARRIFANWFSTWKMSCEELKKMRSTLDADLTDCVNKWLEIYTPGVMAKGAMSVLGELFGFLDDGEWEKWEKAWRNVHKAGTAAGLPMAQRMERVAETVAGLWDGDRDAAVAADGKE